MAQKSTIAKLPEEIRAECDRLIRDGAFTIDQIVEHLQGLGAQVKRSAVGDYKKRMEDRLERYRDAQAVAGVWVARLGEQADSQTGQLIAELLKVVAFQTISEIGGDAGKVEPMDLMLLAKGIDHMASAERKNLDVRKMLHAAWKAEAAVRAEAAAAQVKEAAKSAGLTEEAAASLRELVLGVVG